MFIVSHKSMVDPQTGQVWHCSMCYDRISFLICFILYTNIQLHKIICICYIYINPVQISMTNYNYWCIF